MTNKKMKMTAKTPVLSAISHQDIVMGMDQSQVMAAWGSPRDVETAGSGASGAERWLYYSRKLPQLRHEQA